MVFIAQEKIYFVLAKVHYEKETVPTKCNMMVSYRQPATVDEAYDFRSYISQCVRDRFEDSDNKIEKVFILSITPL